MLSIRLSFRILSNSETRAESPLSAMSLLNSISEVNSKPLVISSVSYESLDAAVSDGNR